MCKDGDGGGEGEGTSTQKERMIARRVEGKGRADNLQIL